MVVKEFTSLTISFHSKFPSLLIIWLYHNFWPITSQNLHYYDCNCSLYRSNVLDYISFLMQPFVFLEFVNASFSFALFSV